MSAKTVTSGLALCLLLTAAAPCATVQAERSTQSSCQARGKAKGRAAGRAGRGSKSKAAPQTAPAEPAAAESDSDVSDDLSGLDDIAPRQPEPAASKPRPSAPAPTPPPARPEPEEEEAAEPEAAESSTESTDTQDEPSAAPAPESASEEGERGPSVRIEPYAGFGIATRSVRMPSTDGVLKVAPGVTPAAEVGLKVVVWPAADFSFFVNLIYQSALGFTVTERPPLSIEKEVRARSERVALEVAPRWRVAGGKLELAVPVGATVRTLWAEVHTSKTPSFSLVGPHARVELRVALSDMLSLRLAPELQYIMMVDRDLLTAGTTSQGMALGGDASLEAQLSEAWSIRIAYRESHASLGAARGSVTFQDVERYLTLRVVGSF